MKKFIILSIGFFSFVLMVSCKKSFLNIPALGVLTTNQLENEKGIEQLLIGAYSQLHLIPSGRSAWESSPDNWVFGSIAGGDAGKGSVGGDIQEISDIANFSAQPTNNFFNTTWVSLYEGVRRANEELRFLKQNMGIANEVNLSAQAHFLRAHFYFQLKRMFNMVPYIDEVTQDVNVPNTDDIWPKIEADFKYAYENLPDLQEDRGRANKWAAGAYLAKTYLYEHKYPEAIRVFNDVIENGMTSNGLAYKLMPEFEDNFLPRLESVNSEAVFSIQMAANVNPEGTNQANAGGVLNFPGNTSPFGCCGFFDPNQDLVNHCRTNADGLPYLDDFNNPSNVVKSDQGVLSSASFTPDNGTLDPRLDWTVGRRGIPFLDWGNHPGANWIYDQAFSGGYSPKKNIYWQKNSSTDKDVNWNGTAIDYHIIRFADVLLMAAECEVEAGSLVTAEKYVNIVRQRAANPDGWVYKYIDNSNPNTGFLNVPAANYKISIYPDGSFTSGGRLFAQKAVRFERKIELAMEGHRFFDLVRWGTAEKEMNDFFAYQGSITNDVKNGHFISGKNEYYPIPQTQIDLSKNKEGGFNLKQNPGY